MTDIEGLYRRIERLWTGQEWHEWSRTAALQYRFDPGTGDPRDLAGTLRWSTGIFAAFPDYSQDLEHVVVTGATAVGVAVCRGTHTGTLDLDLGFVLGATGRGFELPYVKVLDFDADGLVVRDRQYLDATSLLDQIAG